LSICIIGPREQPAIKMNNELKVDT
jgi:hypothetical protein